MLETGQNSTMTPNNSESSISSRITSSEKVHGILETGGNLSIISAEIDNPEGNPTCTSMAQNNPNYPVPLVENIPGNLETPRHSGPSTSKEDPVCTTLNRNIAELSAPRKFTADNQTENILKTLETGDDFELTTIESNPACTPLRQDIAEFPSADDIKGNSETGPDPEVNVSEKDPACAEVTHNNASNTALDKSYLEKFHLKECSVILQRGELFDGPSENHV